MKSLWILQLTDRKEKFLSETEHLLNETTYEVYGALNKNLKDIAFDKTGENDERTLLEYEYTIPSEVIIAFNDKDFYSLVYINDTKAEHEFTKWLIKFKVVKTDMKDNEDDNQDDNQYMLEPAKILYFEYHRTSSKHGSHLEEFVKYFNGYYEYSSNFDDKINITGEKAKKMIEDKILKEKEIQFPVKPVENL